MNIERNGESIPPTPESSSAQFVAESTLIPPSSVHESDLPPAPDDDFDGAPIAESVFDVHAAEELQEERRQREMDPVQKGSTLKKNAPFIVLGLFAIVLVGGLAMKLLSPASNGAAQPVASVAPAAAQQQDDAIQKPSSATTAVEPAASPSPLAPPSPSFAITPPETAPSPADRPPQASPVVGGDRAPTQAPPITPTPAPPATVAPSQALAPVAAVPADSKELKEARALLAAQDKRLAVAEGELADLKREIARLGKEQGVATAALAAIQKARDEQAAKPSSAPADSAVAELKRELAKLSKQQEAAAAAFAAAQKTRDESGAKSAPAPTDNAVAELRREVAKLAKQQEASAAAFAAAQRTREMQPAKTSATQTRDETHTPVMRPVKRAATEEARARRAKAASSTKRAAAARGGDVAAREEIIESSRPSPRAAAAAGYRVHAVKDNLVWLAGAGGVITTYAVGDELPSVGKITAIDEQTRAVSVGKITIR